MWILRTVITKSLSWHCSSRTVSGKPKKKTHSSYWQQLTWKTRTNPRSALKNTWTQQLWMQVCTCPRTPAHSDDVQIVFMSSVFCRHWWHVEPYRIQASSDCQPVVGCEISTFTSPAIYKYSISIFQYCSTGVTLAGNSLTVRDCVRHYSLTHLSCKY